MPSQKKEPVLKPFSHFLPWACLISEGVVLTKKPAFLSSFKIALQDFAFKEDEHILLSLRKLKLALNRLSQTGFSLTVDTFNKESNRTVSPGKKPSALDRFLFLTDFNVSSFFYTEIYLTVGYALSTKYSLKQMKFNEKTKKGVFAELSAFEKVLHEFENQLGDRDIFSSCEKLNSRQLISFLHSTFGKDIPLNLPECGFYLDSFLSDCSFFNETTTKINNDSLFCLSIHAFPESTFPSLISKLLGHRFPFRVSSYFEFLSPKDAKKKASSIVRNNAQQKQSLLQSLTDSSYGDEGVLRMADEANFIAGNVGLSGDLNLGFFSLVAVIKDEDYGRGKQNMNEISKTINQLGFLAKEETLNNALVFLSSLPGSTDYRVRKHLITTGNLSHIIPLSTQWQGERFDSHLASLTGIAEPTIKARTGATLFHVNLNVGDVGHTLVVGPTGSGKSIFLNTLAINFLKYRGAKVFFFDKDASSRFACHNVGGLFYDFSSSDEFKKENLTSQTLRLNPFSGLGDDALFHWLTSFLIGFFSWKGLHLSPEDEEQVRETLALMRKNESQDWHFQRFAQAIQNEAIRSMTKPFISGEYASFFQKGNDDFFDSQWTTFEMGGLMNQKPEIIQFILAYLFFKIENLLEVGGKPVLLVLDEAWLFLDNDFFGSAIRGWLKTLRKKNVYVVLATQEMEDAKTGIFSTILNNCLTRIYLPNLNALSPTNQEFYRTMGLNEVEIHALSRAIPKRDYLYHSPAGAQMFSLGLSKEQIKFLTTYETTKNKVYEEEEIFIS